MDAHWTAPADAIRDRLDEAARERDVAARAALAAESALTRAHASEEAARLSTQLELVRAENERGRVESQARDARASEGSVAHCCPLATGSPRYG